MASITEAAQHVATCDRNLDECPQCEDYLFAGSMDFANAVMDAAFAIVTSEDTNRG